MGDGTWHIVLSLFFSLTIFLSLGYLFCETTTHEKCPWHLRVSSCTLQHHPPPSRRLTSHPLHTIKAPPHAVRHPRTPSNARPYHTMPARTTQCPLAPPNARTIQCPPAPPNALHTVKP